MSTPTFIERAKEVHGDKYDYSLVDCSTFASKVEIICPKHGIFRQSPNNHIYNKNGCLKCSKRGKTSSTTEEFIEKARKIHGDKYDYSLVDYTTRALKIKIVCLKHGMFEQTPANHLAGNGCFSCKSSLLENIVENWLRKNNVIFKKEKRFKDCRDERPLPFDFYLPNKNTLIEFQGKQHFEESGENAPFPTTKEYLLKYQKHDLIKKEWALKNGYKFLEIPYTLSTQEVYSSLKNFCI
jgi:hypothetical protein